MDRNPAQFSAGRNSVIVDCFTHTWESADELGRCLPASGHRPCGPQAAVEPNAAGPVYHLAAAAPVQRTIVSAFKSRYLDAEISNDQVSAYVRQHADRLIGFAGIDPTDPREAVAELQRAKEELGMQGMAVAPAAQDCHPTSSQAMLVYAQAAELSLPILFHTGVFLCPAAKLEYARPHLLDEVARELPHARLVVARMGFPWIEETLVLLQKHPHVYAEVSGVLNQPWRAYQALVSAHQSGVMDKLLFGSGFPSGSASRCIETLYSLNQLVHGTSLPTIPRELLRGIVERDTLRLLNIADRAPSAPLQPAGVSDDHGDA